MRELTPEEKSDLTGLQKELSESDTDVKRYCAGLLIPVAAIALGSKEPIHLPGPVAAMAGGLERSITRFRNAVDAAKAYDSKLAAELGPEQSSGESLPETLPEQLADASPQKGEHL